MRLTSITTLVAATAVTGLVAAAAPPAASAASPASLDVEFRGCQDIASITTAPTANVRARVPSQYELTGTDTRSNVIVRAVTCAGITAGGTDAGGGAVAQLGANIASPDGTGDINNASIEYVTDNKVLASRLRDVGVPARWAKVDGSFTAVGPGSATGAFSVSSPAEFTYRVAGDVQAPAGAPTSYQANWWTTGSPRMVMKTTVPELRFGTAQLSLTTPAGGALAALLGRTSTGFEVFDSANELPTAHMTVRPA